MMSFAFAKKPHLNRARQAKPVQRQFPANNLQKPAAYPVQPKTVCACGGGCSRCVAIPPIQTKLRIGRPDDRYEQEADQVADQIMGMPEPAIHREPT